MTDSNNRRFIHHGWVERVGELSFSGQLNDPSAGADGELEVPEEVEPKETVYPAFCRQVMGQNFQVRDLLPDRGGRPHGYARRVFNAAASNNALALQQGIGRVISKLNQNDGVDEILVAGRETGGLARGPAIQIWDEGGNLLLTRFVLNGNFTNLTAFPVGQNGDGDDEIGVGGVETSGLVRGPAYQGC